MKNTLKIFGKFGIFIAAGILGLVLGFFLTQVDFSKHEEAKQEVEQVEAVVENDQSFSDSPCENENEIQRFENPERIEWLAEFGGCLNSCEGGAFRLVAGSDDDKFERFAGYLKGGKAISEEFFKRGLVLKVSGVMSGIDADHPKTMFNNKCVPIIDIDKIEIEADCSGEAIKSGATELYKCNVSGMEGEPIVRDIDGDGNVEKVVRYGMAMADRLIEILYIYREIDGEYKLIKQFEGDPYGFARMFDDGTIVVGRYIPYDGSQANGGALKNWDDFEEYEMTKYKWTKDGEVKLDQEIIKADDAKNEISKNHYLN